MIKRNKACKQKLLKEEETEINNETFFDDMSVCPSEIFRENDHSYYCLNEEAKKNPYMFDEE